MRIGIWAYHWNKDFTTAPWRSLFEIVSALAEHELKYELICLTRPGVNFDFSNPRVSCVEVKRNWASRSEIKALNLDLLVENIFPRKLKSLLFRVGLAPKKWVFVHGHGPWEMEEVFDGEPLSLMTRLSLQAEKKVVRQACRTYTHFICNSQYTADFLKEKNLCQDSKKITVVALGAEVNDFIAHAETLRPPPPSNGDRPLKLLHIANSSNLRRKGTHLVVEACSIANQEGLDFTLTVVGDQALKKGYRKIVDRAGFGERVHFTGTVAREELLTLFSTHDLLLSPSLHEGFGLHLVEGMAAGAVVVATAVGAIPEVVGDAGILIDRDASADNLYQAIAALVEPGTAWRELQSHGRRRAQHFTWAHSAAALDSAFRDHAI